MATLYTNRILTPSVSAFHDIEGLPSIDNWVNSQTPTYANPGVNYPFYLKTPLLSFVNSQFGFAPYTTFNFFAYGTEFLGTTACYEIFDEYKITPTTTVCKSIPLLSSVAPPPGATVLSEVSGANVAAAWYITVSKHPVDLTTMKAKSIVIMGVGINSTAYYSTYTLDITDTIPEVAFRTIYDNNALQLIYDFNPLITTDASYNIVANKIALPQATNFSTSSVYTSALSFDNTLFTIPIGSSTAGRFYTFIHNSTEGTLAETVFVSGKEITQATTYTRSPGVPSGINVFVTNSGELSCTIPTGTWNISGIFVDFHGSSSNTLKKIVDSQVRATPTLIDSITAYNAATYSIYGSAVNADAGSVAAKYDLNLQSSDTAVVENRTLYLNWYTDYPNIVENITTNSNISSQLFQLSATQRGNVLEVYGIPQNNSIVWNVSGYKTEINFQDVPPGTQQITLNSLLSSSWVGTFDYSSFNVGTITPISIDTVYYYDEFDSNNPSKPLTGSKFNYGGIWDVVVAIPGGDPIVKKNITAVWSDPSIGRITYNTKTDLYSASGTAIYSQISAALGLFAFYDTEQQGAPITIGLRSNIPIEIYACKSIFSSEQVQLNNTSLTEPLTAQINNINTLVSQDTTEDGALYNFLVRNKTNSTDTAIYTYQQLANKFNTAGLLLSSVYLNTAPNISISSTKTVSSINLLVSSTGIEYYIAGYKTYNNSHDILPNTFTLTIDSSGLILDSIPTTIGYDAAWHITLNSYNGASTKVIDTSIVFNDANVYSIDTKERTSTSVNSNTLSAVKVVPVYTPSTVYLVLTSAQIDMASLTSVQAIGYRYGVSNSCIHESIEPILPSAPEIEVEHTFIYPGAYTVSVSAISGNNVVKHITKDYYFKILDIPPLVNFNITNTAPTLSNYTPKQSALAKDLSYYTTNAEITSLTGYDTYINTWSTAPGSFPVNAIWIDFGDGTNIEKISRNRNITSNYTELAFADSTQDPRNYVFQHTYTIPDYGSYTYTVTVTAFSQNTGAYSIGSKTITNITPTAPVKKYLLNNSILDDGTIVYNMQIDQSTSKRMYSPAAISTITYTDPRYYNIIV